MVEDIAKATARVMEAYRSAVLAKDVSAFMRLYDPGVRVFDAWGVWSYEGAAAWQVAVEGWFTSLGGELVKVTFDDVRTTEGRDLSMLSAIVTYAGLSATSEPLRSMQNRISWGNTPRRRSVSRTGWRSCGAIPVAEHPPATGRRRPARGGTLHRPSGTSRARAPSP